MCPTYMNAAVNLSFVLELNGENGYFYPYTLDRAALRAVTAALQWRPWCNEGIRRIVIATTSQYIINGVENWIES